MRTERQKTREKRNRAIVREFARLAAGGGSRVEITRYLMKKYQIYSESTIWKIRKDYGSPADL